MSTPGTVPLSTGPSSIPSLDIPPHHNEQFSNMTSSAKQLLNITYHYEELLSPTGHYAMGTALAFIALMGMIQNSVTLFALSKRKNPQRIEFLIKVLLVCDLLMCLLSLPFAVTSSFARRWLFGQTGCNWYGFSMFFLGVFSINVLTAISIERYLTVKRIMQVAVRNNTWLLVISLMASGVSALVWSVLPLLGVSSYKPEGVGTSCSVNWMSKQPQDRAYFIVILIVCFIIPLGTIITCYSSIYIQVSSRPWSIDLKKKNNLTQRRIRMEIHLAKVISSAAGLFVLAWSPYAVINLVALITEPEAIPPLLYSMCAIFAKSSVFGNSFVYVFMNRDLRRACLQNLGLGRNTVAVTEAIAFPKNTQSGLEPGGTARKLVPRETMCELYNMRTIVGVKADSPQYECTPTL